MPHEKISELPPAEPSSEERQEMRLQELETQVASLTERLNVERQRNQQMMAEFLEMLGATMVQQGRGIKERIVYPTTIRSVPEEEAENEATLFLTTKSEEPVLYKQTDDGMVPVGLSGVDTTALSNYLDTKGNVGGMYKVNVYVDR